MKYYGNIEVVRSQHINLVVENRTTEPDTRSAGRVYFDTDRSVLRLDNGVEYIDVTIPSDFNNLITTLGSNWINSTYTFNPTAFNSLDNVSGLTSNNSLFDVFSQLDSAITSAKVRNLTDLNDVASSGVVEGNVLFFNGAEYSFTSINSLLDSYAQLKIASLRDVDVSSLTDGQVLVYNAASATFKSQTIVQTYDDFQSNQNHLIIHSLGVQYCGLTLINTSTNTLITDAVVTFNDVNQITVSLPYAAPVTAIMTAIPVAN
jgi:hypothetical protein